MEDTKAMPNTIHEEVLAEPKNAAAEKPATARHIESLDVPAPHLHSKTFLVVAAVSFIQFAGLIQLVATGAFASTVALVVGGADISGWMLTALTITFVVFAPPVSQASDYWGRRWLLIILTMSGCVGTIITSRAQSMGVAILGEAFVGAAFATTPLCFAVASEVLPHRHRLAGQACINAASGLGATFSLLLGAKLIEVRGPGGFRILWYINAGLYAVAAVVCFALYRPPTRELQASLTTKEKLHRLDWPGYAITTCAAVLLCMGFSWADNPYGWRNAHVVAPIVVGGCLFVALWIYAWKVRSDSFMPHALFSRDRNLAMALVFVFVEGLVFGAANVYVPFQTSVLYQTSFLNVALVFAIALICYTVVGPVAAVVCSRFKQVRSLIVAGFACFLIFGICMATATLRSRNAIWGFQVFLGTGLSLVLNALVTAAQLSAPPEYIAIASGLLAAIRSLGVTIAVALYSAIFHSRISRLLPSKIAAAALANGLPESSLPMLIGDLANNKADALANIPGVTPQIIGASVTALKEAYLESFKSVWIAVCCFCAVGVVGSFFFVNPAKDLNNQIDAPAESEKDLYG